VDLRRADTVLVPTATDPGGPPPPPAPGSHRLDAYVCLRAKPAKKFCAQDPNPDIPHICNRDDDCGDEGPCVKGQDFPKSRAVSFADRFGTRALLAKKMVRVCVAANEDYGRIADVRLGLACYQVKPAKSLCASAPELCAPHVRQSFFATSDVASQALTTLTMEEACVPARINAYEELL